MKLKLLVLACALALGSIGTAQAAGLMTNPSVDELRQALTAPQSRAFHRTEPPTREGLCPMGQGSRAVDSRNLEPVPYGGAEAPHADLAVQFANASDALTPGGRALLDKVAQVLSQGELAQARLAVAGHTDATGSENINRELSCARAISVRSYLISRGIAPDRLAAYGFGSSKPLEQGAVRSATNRRVEFRLPE